MPPLFLKQVCAIKGKVSLPGDKSISHRAIILSAVSSGQTIIENFPDNQDCFYTLSAFKQLGIKIKKKGRKVIVSGKGLYGLKKPDDALFLGESGTTLRLLLGLLAGQDFKVKLTAAPSLAQRPMRRVTIPLRKMGAVIKAQVTRRKAQVEEYPPMVIEGGNLKAIQYKLPVASAQVKSALLLAGLYAQGETQVIEPIPTRDHTERMLKLFKANLKIKKNKIILRGKKELVSPGRIYIPADISSASFFMVAAAILPNSKILLEDVSLNPSRTGIIKVLKRMKVNIRVIRRKAQGAIGEPMGDIIVKSSRLKGTTVKKREIPSLIDELPVLMVAACYAKGRSVLEGVEELRVKETDRIQAMLVNLKKMGAEIKAVKSGRSERIMIKGNGALRGCRLKSFGDHRTVMSVVIAALKAKGSSFIDDIGCINKSFPGFIKQLFSLT